MLLNIAYIGVLVLCLIVGLITVNRKSQVAYKYLLAVIAITVFNEGFLMLITSGNKKLYTVIFYNMFLAMRIPLYMAMFLDLIPASKCPKWVWKFLIVITALMPFVMSLFYDPFKIFFTPVYLVDNFLFLIASLYYFYILYRDDNIVKPFSQPIVISIAAIVCFILVMMPFMGLYNSYIVRKLINVVVLQKVLAKSLSLFLYSFIAFDFYQQWKRKKLS